MKKLNLNHQVDEDDEKLISLLRTSISREASEQFVDNTLQKFLTLKVKRKKLYKPLKLPLYLMLVIGFILLAPIFIMLNSQVSPPDFGLEWGDFIENMSFQLDSWYTLTPLLLVLVLISVVWIELGLFKFRNPFV
ncbi:hypothetical protein [Ulvibacterium sp.]|uniref:hypothetical protein n=1 Tax=Ulvibacterium sp. TaxID=2665914 RepID=UPI002638AEA8|nr:hypothetical protein [Ulvibacterium sp.]